MGGMLQADTNNPGAEVLAGFFPFLDLDHESLIVAAGAATLIQVPAGSQPISRGSDDEWAFYLLEGRLELQAEDGVCRMLDAGTDKAIYPISTLRPHRYDVTAVDNAILVQIRRQDLDNLIADCEHRHEAVYVVDAAPADSESLDTPVFKFIHQHLIDGSLTVPSLPEVATKIQQLVSTDADTGKLVKTIQSDPAVAAKLVRAANSPMYRGRAQIESCTDAVVRLGRRTVSTLVMSFVMRELFHAKNPLMRQRMVKLWEHSTTVASVSFILAKLLGEFEPEQALLAGLVHDIGVIPILETIDRHPDLAPAPEEIEDTIKVLRGDIGGLILEKWGFSEELVDVAWEAECWYRESGSSADLCDLVLIAQLHSFVGTQNLECAPPMYDLPAFSKMTLGPLTPELSLQICNQAEEEIERARAWLTS